MGEIESPKLEIICPLRWSKFIEQMTSVSPIELQCHLWSIFALRCCPKLLKIVASNNGQHPWARKLASSINS
jgi:hypothetical protein